jgi:predicted anti-sigma-YlaC factor YlaD
MVVPSAACERARASVSRDLDGELSELSRRGLRRHLARCPDCAQYAVDVEWFTALLRDAPAEPYRWDATGIRRRSRPSRVRRLVPSIAALVLAGLGSATVLSHELRGDGVSPGTSTSFKVVTVPSPPIGSARAGESVKLPIGQRLAGEEF